MAETSANHFVVAAGGTGMRCLQSFVNLCAIGMFKDIGKIHILLMDTDEENGDKRNAENLIQSYQKIQKSVSNGGYFNCELELSVFVPDYSKDTRKNFIILSQLERGNSDTNHKLANIFFEDIVQEFDLSHGYRAQTHLGSYLMYHAFIEEIRKSQEDTVYGNNSQLYHFIQAIASANNTEARVFSFGSSFGGTGASSIPVIPKAITDCAKIVTAGSLNLDKIFYGGVVLSSYFKFKPPSDAEKKKKKVIANSQFFTHNSATALNFYVNDFTISKTYKRLYLLGWPTNLNVDIDDYKKEALQGKADEETVTGGKAQENPAHVLEIFSAAATHHFFHPSITDSKTLNNINATQFRYKSMTLAGDGKKESSKMVFDAEDILHKNIGPDSKELPIHEVVRKNLIAFFAFGKLVHSEYKGNLMGLVDDLKLYNSSYEVNAEIIESFQFFLNYFSLLPKGESDEGFNPGWLSQAFFTFAPEGEKDFLGIKSEFFKHGLPKNWNIAYPQLDSKNSKNNFVNRFKKLHKNKTGDFSDFIENIRTTFYDFDLDSKIIIQEQD